MADKKPAPFSPHGLAVELGATFPHSGINWSYVNFDSEEKMREFVRQCNKNGYRTRSEGDGLRGNWPVQYHHYQD